MRPGSLHSPPVLLSISDYQLIANVACSRPGRSLHSSLRQRLPRSTCSAARHSNWPLALRSRDAFDSLPERITFNARLPCSHKISREFLIRNFPSTVCHKLSLQLAPRGRRPRAINQSVDPFPPAAIKRYPRGDENKRCARNVKSNGHSAATVDRNRMPITGACSPPSTKAYCPRENRDTEATSDSPFCRILFAAMMPRRRQASRRGRYINFPGKTCCALAPRAPESTIQIDPRRLVASRLNTSIIIFLEMISTLLRNPVAVCVCNVYFYMRNAPAVSPARRAVHLIGRSSELRSSCSSANLAASR